MKVIGVIQVKGGAGRSTVSTNLAGELSKIGNYREYRFYIGARPFMREGATIYAWTTHPGATIYAWTISTIHSDG